MEQEYYGWIFVEEKLPLLDENVLIAYVEEDDKDVEYMVTRRCKQKIIYTETEKWMLPQYYKQSCVRAWRKIPVFTVI